MNKTVSGMNDTGAGIAFFTFALTMIFVWNQTGDRRYWLLFTFGLILTMAWDTTVTMVLLFTLFAGFFVLRRQTLLAFSSVVCFYYLLAGSDFLRIAIIGAISSLTGGTPHIEVSGTSIGWDLSAVLVTMDRMLTFAILAAISIIILLQIVSAHRQSSHDIRQPHYLLLTFIFGAGMSIIVFVIYKGLFGAVFRLPRYVAPLVFVGVPVVLFLFHSHRIPTSRFRHSILTLVVILMIVSPAAILTGHPDQSKTHFTHTEATGITTTQQYLPSDASIYATQHLAPTYGGTHDRVILPNAAHLSNQDFQTTLSGIFHSPGGQETTQALSILEDRYFPIEYIALSTRASEEGFGIKSAARVFEPADEGYTNQYGDKANRVYVNGELVLHQVRE
ncbi:hypothetical protein [Halobaculum rarum]|uniref:hypothetical protein n=1 Tax=Halobaculum rarum TaxID=3075122 RepID=UPI0032B00B3A